MRTNVIALALALGSVAPAQAYEAVTVENGGGLRGLVTFEGHRAPPEQVLIGKDNHVCGDGHVVPDRVRASQAGRLADVVVFIERIEAGKPWTAAREVEIVQEKCAFHPYVQVARKGAELKVVNKDPLLHNIHAYELIGRARRTLFNIAQPQAGQIDRHALKLRRGDVVEIDCDAHNWMSAWVHTLDHPYFAVTRADGGFRIADVPPGRYQLVAWHPALGSRTTEITVDSGTVSSVDFTFQSSQS